jgi:hypothetical protein
MTLNIFKLRNKRKKQKRLHFIIDTSLSLFILILIVVLVTINLYKPKPIDPIIVEPEKPDDPPIAINDPLEINFSLDSNISRFNSGVLLNIDYLNHSQDMIDKVELSFESLSSAFTISNIQSVMLDKYSSLVARNLIIEDIPSLEGGEISLMVYFSKPSDPLISQVAWRALVNINYLEENFKKEHNFSSICFLSDTNVTAKAYYHSARGDQLGIGPIPPIVDIPTSYWVFFEIENLGNDLEDFVISALLPSYASLSDKKTLLAGNYSYNDDNRRLIWQVNQVNKTGGAYRAGFEVEILANESHVGEILNIVENISYRFRDSLCGFEISNNLGNLDTNLKYDFINQDQGRVIE